MSFRTKFLGLVATLILVGAAEVLRAAVIYVDVDPADGTWGGALTDVQSALGMAVPGDEIWVAKGAYRPALPGGDRKATFRLKHGVALYGGFIGGEPEKDQRDWVANVTILSGDLNGNDGANFLNYAENVYHVLTIDGVDPEAQLDGFTVSGGNASAGYPDYNGAGITGSGDPVIRNCTIRDNWGSNVSNHGAGLYTSGSPAFTNCAFLNNFGSFQGGAAFIGEDDDGPGVSFVGCLFSENEADWGGALFPWDGAQILLSDCIFLANTAHAGGAMAVDGSSATTVAVNCLFLGNHASSSGGALYSNYEFGSFTNCVFSGNSAGTGGAVNNDHGAPAFTNCTFTGNSATLSAGGLYTKGYIYGVPSIRNCILWGNSDLGGVDESAQIAYVVGEAPEVGYSSIQGWTGTIGGEGNIGLDPYLVDSDGLDNIKGTEDDDLRLRPESPCIDAADNSAIAAVIDAGDLDNDGLSDEPIPRDLDGNQRFFDQLATTDSGSGPAPVVDMGAYEYTDCNSNDILDTLDISSGTSVDCTQNLVPDECEPDCNSNGQADSCDIAAGASSDTNGNGAPDECQVTLFVNKAAVGANDGSSWTDAYIEMRDALTHAAGSHGAVIEIWVAAGTYTPAEANGDRQATFRLLSDLALYGGFVGGETDRDQRDPIANVAILSGDLNGDDLPAFERNSENSFHVVTAGGTDSTAVLDGFSITGGNADDLGSDDDGAGIHVVLGSPTLTACKVTANSSSDDGGGMYNEGGAPTLTGCSFIGNQALVDDYWWSGGGGMYNTLGSPTLHACTFSENAVYPGYYSVSGGGGYHDFIGSSVFNVCSFTGNVADGGGSSSGGGGLFTSFGSTTLTGCTFEANSAIGANDSSDSVGGGGIMDYDGSVTLNACTFTTNATDHRGGGAFTKYGILDLTGCVLFGNTADLYGGGVSEYIGTLTLRDCRFEANQALSGGGAHSLYGGNAVVGCSFVNNVAVENGGGAYAFDDFTNCAFYGNTAGEYGGGAYTSYDTWVRNCLFTGNHADEVGGGVYAGFNMGSAAYIRNSTLGGNTAGQGTDGFHAAGMGVVVTNSILFGNGGGTKLDQISGDLNADYSCIQGLEDGDGTGNISDDPMFVDPDGQDEVVGTEDDDLGLTPGSPAIDAADNDSVPDDAPDLDGDGDEDEPIPFDVSGHARFFDDPFTVDSGVGTPPIVDMGALEFFNDCNLNDVPDSDDIANGDSVDLNANLIPDECEPSVAHNLTQGTDHVSIQLAIESANAGDVIQVDPGTHAENLDFLSKDITVRSRDPLNPTVVADTLINGGARGPCVQLSAGEISGFTIINGGDTDGLSGGVHATGTAVVSFNVITLNTGDSGGAGGIGAFDAVLVHHNQILSNTSDSKTGGVNARDDAWVIDNVINGNQGNTAAGVRARDRAVIRNNTITSNIATGNGGSVQAENQSQVTSNIIAFALNGSGLDVVVGGTVLADYNCVFGNADGNYSGAAVSGPNDINADPLLEPDSLHLDGISPCIHGGDPNLVPLEGETDLDGEERIDGGRVDIGADEAVDCNGNGSGDDVDIALGLSLDENGNGVPDECEDIELCPADANGDGVIDPLDSGFVLARFGCDPVFDGINCVKSDTNGDGNVDPLDVGFVLARFGNCP